ncbi:MAG: hypothetical protein Q8L37_00285 [Candidatus Gottesmanbacteria bacterium]|nr:hypothetical protein [Candidatus Gottesmanbacteria bacterium]
MSIEQESPLTDPELDHQLMELLSKDEFTMQYMVAYQVLVLEKAIMVALYDASEDEPFERAHAIKLRDFLRSGVGTDRLNELRDQMKTNPEAMYDWMYGYFLDLLSSDSEE